MQSSFGHEEVSDEHRGNCRVSGINISSSKSKSIQE